MTRSFPLSGRGQGVASAAYNSRKIVVVNSMGEELKVRGEARLAAMVCIPVPNGAVAQQSRQVVLLNIDSGVPDAFPKPNALDVDPAGGRLEQLATLLAQINALYCWVVEGTQRADVPPIQPGALLPAKPPSDQG